MSRSRKKTPITGVTLAESEKQDKVKAHRAYRRTLKQTLTPDLETPLPLERQLKDVWEMAKEGKSYDATLNPKRMRK
jgi:hypothetical protein